MLLGENIESRQAAGDLEETLQDMVALHRDRAARVEPLLDRVREHMRVIAGYADKDEEKRNSTAIEDSFARYVAARQSGDLPHAGQILEGELLPTCQELRRFNAGQVELLRKNIARICGRWPGGWRASASWPRSPACSWVMA